MDTNSSREMLIKRIQELEENQSTLMATCRSLAKELESRDPTSGNRTQIPGSNEQTAQLIVRCSDLEKELVDAKETIDRYKTSEEAHASELEAMSARLGCVAVSGLSSDPSRHQAQLDRLCATYKAQVAVAEERAETAEVALGQLRRERAVQANYASIQQVDDRADLQAELDALKAQLAVYADDFASERKDREVAQQRATELKTENEVLLSQLEQFQTNTMTRLHQNRIASLSNLHNEYAQNRQAHHNAHLQYSARGRPVECDSDDMPRSVPVGMKPMPLSVVSDCVANEDCSRNMDIIDTLETARDSDDSNREDDSGLLKCPKCDEGYSPDDHAEFLDHIEACCDA